ncbi:MAG: zinc-finger domain-containing protein [Gammaproteobacteria bacterium SHHR-1]|uniref:zinc-finger domain-containing protein n=1 Tax=Magnetovirga frankeli TaxID=947516 RepID=UPI001293D333|nr:zinc-finger domain-containing protein [gamma proteobacterium SS-5]
MSSHASGIAHQVSSYYKVEPAELPISCPRSNEEVASLHPRVYLSFDKQGQTECPYCGARFELLKE